MTGKPYSVGTTGGLFPDIDIPGYIDTFYRAYNAMGEKLPEKGCLWHAGKKWLDSVLLSAFIKGVGGLPAESDMFGQSFGGTDDERIIVESAVSAYMDEFTSQAYKLGTDCRSKPGFAPKIFETVCAGVVEKAGGDPDEYRQKLRNPGSLYSSAELRASLDNTDKKLN
jgi:hypothetical protein